MTLSRRCANEKRYSRQQGFTLVELLITLAIVVVLLGVAATGFTRVVQQKRATETAANLKASVFQARGEAVTTGGWVGICGSATGNSCANNFNDGWVIFHDVDKDNSLTAADTVLSYYEQDRTLMTVDADSLTAGAGNGPVMFNFRGYPNKSMNFTLDLGTSSNTFILHPNGSIETQDPVY